MTAVMSHSVAGRLPAVMLRRSPYPARRAQPAGVEHNWLTVVLGSAAAVPISRVGLRSLAEIEGEDAHLTGGTRSLMRRVLALNLGGTLEATRTVSVERIDLVR